MPITLEPLLQHLNDLDQTETTRQWQWNGWQVWRVGGGQNNLVYRVSRNDGDDAVDLAVKFTMRDARNRAVREFTALKLLQTLGLSIAPEPVLFDGERYAQPVVVQRWLAGKVEQAPPANDADDDWHKLIAHYMAIHRVTPAMAQQAGFVLHDAVLTFSNLQSGLSHIHALMARLPADHQPVELRDLVHRAQSAIVEDWSPVAPTLCRADPNTLNLVRRPGAWASVDWEYSGWGDPAFELADLMALPQCMRAMDSARRSWVADEYARQSSDPHAATRIRLYHALMLLWWAARFQCMLYERPRGLDVRLVAPEPGWQARIQSNYVAYLGYATSG